MFEVKPRKMKFAGRSCRYALTAAVALSLSIQSGAWALKSLDSKTHAGTSKLSVSAADVALEKDLVILENRFFFHRYNLDPIEKRLERLELLTLGQSQYGTNSLRLSRLQAAIRERDHEAAQVMAKNKASGGTSESNYPVLSTLEWRVLKKTFSSETLDQRLDRLESQLFGVPAQAMSYVDRIERLKKTAGIGIDMAGNSFTSIGPGALPGHNGNLSGSARVRRGPMPRDFGGISPGDNPFSASSSPFFDDNFGSLPDQLLPESGQMGPVKEFGAFTPLPRGSTHSFSFSGPNFDLGSDPAEILEKMQRPMMELLRRFGLSPAAPQSDNGSGSGNGTGTGTGTGTGSDSPNVAPQEPWRNLNKQLTPREELPPYSDPNSI